MTRLCESCANIPQPDPSRHAFGCKCDECTRWRLTTPPTALAQAVYLLLVATDRLVAVRAHNSNGRDKGKRPRSLRPAGSK